MISIPEYFMTYIDGTIDLDVKHKICCPFHHEDTPSFSYNPEKGIWRCFGACQFGGDVYALHQMNKHLKSRTEAIIDLNRMLGIVGDDIDEMAIARTPDDVALRATRLVADLNVYLKLGDIKGAVKTLQELTVYKG